MMDDELPCREMGLEFRRGDIIEVINQDDVNWWQVSWEGSVRGVKVRLEG